MTVDGYIALASDLTLTVSKLYPEEWKMFPSTQNSYVAQSV